MHWKDLEGNTPKAESSYPKDSEKRNSHLLLSAFGAIPTSFKEHLSILTKFVKGLHCNSSGERSRCSRKVDTEEKNGKNLSVQCRHHVHSEPQHRCLQTQDANPPPSLVAWSTLSGTEMFLSDLPVREAFLHHLNLVWTPEGWQTHLSLLVFSTLSAQCRQQVGE